jgi:hypothetical protein
MSSVEKLQRHKGGTPIGRHLRAISGREEAIVLELSFSQLVLVHKALQAVKTLGVLGPQDELLADTTHLVDLALKSAL